MTPMVPHSATAGCQGEQQPPALTRWQGLDVVKSGTG